MTREIEEKLDGLRFGEPPRHLKARARLGVEKGLAKRARRRKVASFVAVAAAACVTLGVFGSIALEVLSVTGRTPEQLEGITFFSSGTRTNRAGSTGPATPGTVPASRREPSRASDEPAMAGAVEKALEEEQAKSGKDEAEKDEPAKHQAAVGELEKEEKDEKVPPEGAP